MIMARQACRRAWIGHKQKVVALHKIPHHKRRQESNLTLTMVNALHFTYLVGLISLLVFPSFAEPKGLRRMRKALEMKDIDQYFQAERLLDAGTKGKKGSKASKKMRRSQGEIGSSGVVYLSFKPIPQEPTPAPRPTPQPTNLPCAGLTRDEALLELLSTVTPEDQLLDADTPQGVAFNWLRRLDTTYDPCTYPTILQRYALAVFFFATGGNMWVRKEGWIMSGNECGWYGVECRLDNGMVTALKLREYSYRISIFTLWLLSETLTLSLVPLAAENNLVGEIPPEINVLTSLEELDLYDNDVSGPFPGSMVDLKNLTMLNVEQNSMSGGPFDVLTALENMRSLRISFNDFNGNLPADISNFEKLRELWIAGNSFDGEIPPEIGQMGALRTFKRSIVLCDVFGLCSFLPVAFPFRISLCLQKQV